MKRIAVVQSNYIPWKGYLDMINMVDEFVLYDDVEYSKNSWRNRNRIKTRQGLQWLSIPVRAKGHSHDAIQDIRIADPNWPAKHWRTISQAYARAEHFGVHAQAVEHLYYACDFEFLSEANHHFLRGVCALFGIETPLRRSREYGELTGAKTERLLDLCQRAGATHYLSGPAAKDYLQEEQMRDGGVQVEWMDYDGYREYPQLHPPFEHKVSCLDVLFNVGTEAPRYLKSTGRSG